MTKAQNLKLSAKSGSAPGGKAKSFFRGFSTLPAILFIGGLVVEIVVALSFMLSFLSNTGLAVNLGVEALFVAHSGVEDGIMKVVRNKDCPTVGCASPYDLSVGGRVAAVAICKDSCAGAGKTQIDSIGMARTERRKIRAVVSVDVTTGKVTVDSISEIDL